MERGWAGGLSEMEMVQPSSWREVQGGTRIQGMMDSESDTVRGCPGFI